MAQWLRALGAPPGDPGWVLSPCIRQLTTAVTPTLCLWPPLIPAQECTSPLVETHTYT